MAQLPANKLIDEIVKRGLHPILKAEGYQKKGRNYYHITDDVIRVVNVQGSQGNTTESSKFTINLGLFFPAARALSLDHYRPIAGLPKEYECTLRKRIGLLTPEHHDHWWRVTPSSNIDNIAGEVGEAWKTSASEWMIRCSDMREAREEAERMGDTFTAAVISVALAESGLAKELFKRTYETSSRQAHGNLEAWAKRHHLLD